MGIPTGQIVGRPMVERACGCKQEFQEFAVDRYRAQRLAKFKQTRCSECVAKLNEEQQRAAATVPKKGEALQLLPRGTSVTMTRKPDGNWAGSLAADGMTVESIADGLQSLTIALARLWAAQHVAKAGPPAPPAAPAAKPAASSGGSRQRLRQGQRRRPQDQARRQPNQRPRGQSRRRRRGHDNINERSGSAHRGSVTSRSAADHRRQGLAADDLDDFWDIRAASGLATCARYARP